ncbi:MAG: mercury methylation corrinoid protein HgcA [Bacillota bacterium]
MSECNDNKCKCNGTKPKISVKIKARQAASNVSNDTELPDYKKVFTTLTLSDRIGGCKARWGIGRMRYIVKPGLYAVGSPLNESPVLVTANYKLSFDALRKELGGIDAWILVLDTKGINVWCAAGKGTFGTAELVRQIRETRVSEVVSHRTLILPQLGAPGVSAHEVAKQAGFRVVYGPVRASEVKAFIEAGLKASPEMRTVKFTTYDRLVLTPIEVVGTLKPLAIMLIVGFFLNYFAILSFGVWDLVGILGAVFAGAVATPVLLPWIPGRAFSFKGWFVGVVCTLILISVVGGGSGLYGLRSAAWLLILPMVSAFIAMNFTGASTYTSPTGVLKEMKIALPIMIASAVAGIGLLVLGRFL